LLSAAQKRHVEAFLRFCPSARTLRRFILQFRTMMRRRSGKKLNAWIKAATTFWILLPGSVCQHAPPRLESGGTVDYNALE
jgi:hypothetical protein